MIGYDLDDETIIECLRLAAKREALDCMKTIRILHPEIIIDEWLVKYAEQRAFEMDCEKFGLTPAE